MASGYDRALSVFSPDGHVFQVEYALEAVKRGTCAVGAKGKEVVVLGCERRSALKLQDRRVTPSKLCRIDNRVTLCFAGLHADARILVDKARVEAQSHRLTMEDPPSVLYMTKYLSGVKQRYTQSGGVRPFGISTLIAGCDPRSDEPSLFLTEPSGIHSAWKAAAIGRSQKTVNEFLERNYQKDMNREDTIKLVIKALLEVVQSGDKNIDVVVMSPENSYEPLTQEQIEEYSQLIVAENEAESSSK